MWVLLDLQSSVLCLLICSSFTYTNALDLPRCTPAARVMHPAVYEVHLWRHAAQCRPPRSNTSVSTYLYSIIAIHMVLPFSRMSSASGLINNGYECGLCGKTFVRRTHIATETHSHGASGALTVHQGIYATGTNIDAKKNKRTHDDNPRARNDHV